MPATVVLPLLPRLSASPLSRARKADASVFCAPRSYIISRCVVVPVYIPYTLECPDRLSALSPSCCYCLSRALDSRSSCLPPSDLIMLQRVEREREVRILLLCRGRMCMLLWMGYIARVICGCGNDYTCKYK